MGCPGGKQHRFVLAHGAGLEPVQDLTVHLNLALGGVKVRHLATGVCQLGECGGVSSAGEVTEVRERGGDRPLLGHRGGGAQHGAELAQ